MAVTVARGVAGRIRKDPGSILLQLQQASDQEAATAALERARDDVWALDGGWRSAPNLGPRDSNGPKYVSDVWPSPGGPLLSVDGGHTPLGLLATIPELVVRRAVEAGLDHAIVASPAEGGTLDGLDAIPRAVVLRLYPPPPATVRQPWEIPAGWLEETRAWLLGLDERAVCAAAVVSVQFPLGAEGCAGFLAQLADARGWGKLVSGDLDLRIRAANCVFTIPPTLALGAGGHAANEADLLAAFGELTDVARRLAPQIAYASVSIEPTFSSFRGAYQGSEWYANGGEAPESIDFLLDTVVPDAYPYQILGPGHLERLGARPPGTEPLAANRVELAVGDPASWLIDRELAAGTRPGYDFELSARRRDPTIPSTARTMLQPCLLKAGEAYPLYLARYVENNRP